jgi:hypothetical protein
MSLPFGFAAALRRGRRQMKTLRWSIVLALTLVACGRQDEPSTAAIDTRDSPQAHSSLAQLMRGLLYPNSEIVFAAQNDDPEASAAAAASAAPLGGEKLYQGWEGVENAALMLSEAASLIVIPGRLCENGLPAPVGNADFQKYAQGLVEAGQAAYEAARTKNMDAVIEAGGVVSDACSFCHDAYRDKPEGQRRCIAGKQ